MPRLTGTTSSRTTSTKFALHRSEFGQRTGRDHRPLGLADKIYQSCLSTLRDFQIYLSKESDAQGLEEELASALEQCVEDLYLWGSSFSNESLESILSHLDYLKECILDAFCKIGALMTKQTIIWPEWTKYCSFKLTCELKLLVELARSSIFLDGSETYEDEDDESDEIENEDSSLDLLFARQGFVQDVATSVRCLLIALPAINRTVRFAQDQEQHEVHPATVLTYTPGLAADNDSEKAFIKTESIEDNQQIHNLSFLGLEYGPKEGLASKEKSAMEVKDELLPSEHGDFRPAIGHHPRLVNSTPNLTTLSGPHERASAAWSPEDDDLLWDARENRKLGWPQTADMFKGKSPNACRKRYERLKHQKAPDEWEGPKFEALAEVYVLCREEMWKKIADQLGDRDTRWQTLEQQCMSKGVRELLRASSRPQRHSPSNSIMDDIAFRSHSGHDHGIFQLAPSLSLNPSSQNGKHSGSSRSSIPSVHPMPTPTRNRMASTVSKLSWDHDQLAPIEIAPSRGVSHDGRGFGPLPGISEGFESFPGIITRGPWDRVSRSPSVVLSQ